MQKDITRTLAYSDVFDYPLTKEEIWKFLIGKKITRALFEKLLFVPPLVKWERKNGHYFLSGRERLVAIRNKRQEISRGKLELAKKIIRKLSFVPAVLFIGISGGLALENADEKDDIDLFVVTSKGTLWITRLLLVLFLKLMGQYRGRGKKESQKICLNMLIDQEALTFEQQDLYTAHEIIQLKPMFDRNNTYEKFLTANRWVLKYLPNTIIKKLSNEVIKDKKQNYLITYLLNYLTKIPQLLYMKKHRTKEIISDKVLAFHPFDYKAYVLKEYNKRLKQYEI